MGEWWSLSATRHAVWWRVSAGAILLGAAGLPGCKASHDGTSPGFVDAALASTVDAALPAVDGASTGAMDAMDAMDASTPPDDESIEGKVIPTPSRTTPGLVVTPARPGELNGAGPFLNAYAAADVEKKCASSTPRILRLWQHNIDFATYQLNGNNDYPYLAPDEAMTWRFIAPPEGTAQILQYNEGTQVRFVSGFLSLSAAPCDFDVQKVADPAEACYRSEVNGISIYYRSTASKAKLQPSECQILPGKTYYLSVRMQDARPASAGGHPTEDSCRAAGSGSCGGYVQIR